MKNNAFGESSGGEYIRTIPFLNETTAEMHDRYHAPPQGWTVDSDFSEASYLIMFTNVDITPSRTECSEYDERRKIIIEA